MTTLTEIIIVSAFGLVLFGILGFALSVGVSLCL